MGFDSVVGLTGLVVGVVGTAVAVYTYYATRTKRELLFLITAAEIIGHSESMFPPELKIFFNDEPIQSLVKHNILVWNSGNVPIRHEDFIKQGAPVEMTFPDEFEMLKSAIVRESSSANDISLSVSDDRRSAACKFLFLEPRDGFNVEILHSGDISNDPQIKFNIIGISRRAKYQQHTIWSAGLSKLPEVGVAIFFIVAFQTLLHIE
jgi:hypothetical protein